MTSEQNGASDYLPPTTRVVSTNDGEPGSVLSSYARDSAGRWIEYEVVTQYGIEIWKRAEMIVLDADGNAR